jgi:anthranilate synthase component 2
MQATRYHSLIVPEESLTADLIVCGWTRDNDNPKEIMALRHSRFPVHGVQFHPESFLTPDGIRLLQNFLSL